MTIKRKKTIVDEPTNISSEQINFTTSSTRRHSSAALSGSDDTGVDELLNFLSDLVVTVVSMNANIKMATITITYHRVLHMVVERSRVLLGV